MHNLEVSSLFEMITADLMKISDNQGSSCGDSSRISNGICTDLSSTESGGSSSERNYIPSCVGEIGIPFINQIFESLDKGYTFYKEYGRLGGFCVRKVTKKDS